MISVHISCCSVSSPDTVDTTHMLVVRFSSLCRVTSTFEKHNKRSIWDTKKSYWITIFFLLFPIHEYCLIVMQPIWQNAITSCHTHSSTFISSKFPFIIHSFSSFQNLFFNCYTYLIVEPLGKQAICKLYKLI